MSKDQKDIELLESEVSIEASLDDLYPEVLQSLESEDHQKLDGLVDKLHPSDLADLLERLPLEHRENVFQHLPPERMGAVLNEASTGVLESIISDVSKGDLQEAIENLESDEAVDIVRSLEEDRAEEFVGKLPEEQQELFTYKEDTAGGLMKLEYVSVPADWKIENVLEHMRENQDDMPDMIDTVYVVGYKKKLIGSVALSRLVKLPLDKNMQDVMWENPVSVDPEMDQEEVARLFEKYDIYSCPVINSNGQVLGVIAIDDILDVVVEEHEEDIMRAAGLSEGEDLFAPTAETTRKRFPWLFVNLLTAILASFVIAMFEDQIEKLVVLAVLMPIVASMGGNAGTQTMTVAVRGLAMKQLTFQNALALMKKEVQVGGFNGVLLAFLLALGVVVIYGDYALGAVICAATIANHLLAAFAGIAIPIYLEKFGKDPAVSSGVLLTTVTDVGGFFIFLGLAAIFLI